MASAKICLYAEPLHCVAYDHVSHTPSQKYLSEPYQPPRLNGIGELSANLNTTDVVLIVMSSHDYLPNIDRSEHYISQCWYLPLRSSLQLCVYSSTYCGYLNPCIKLAAVNFKPIFRYGKANVLIMHVDNLLLRRSPSIALLAAELIIMIRVFALCEFPLIVSIFHSLIAFPLLP